MCLIFNRNYESGYYSTFKRYVPPIILNKKTITFNVVENLKLVLILDTGIPPSNFDNEC